MNLLFSNDRRGEHPQSYYAASAAPIDRFAALQGTARADVCIVGAGFTPDEADRLRRAMDQK